MNITKQVLMLASTLEEQSTWRTALANAGYNVVLASSAQDVATLTANSGAGSVYDCVVLDLDVAGATELVGKCSGQMLVASKNHDALECRLIDCAKKSLTDPTAHRVYGLVNKPHFTIVNFVNAVNSAATPRCKICGGPRCDFTSCDHCHLTADEAADYYSICTAPKPSVWTKLACDLLFVPCAVAMVAAVIYMIGVVLKSML